MPSLLVIDDELSIQHAFRRVFSNADIDILSAGTAAEGLAAVSQSAPDAIIIDVGLPDMSGLDLFRIIRKDHSKIPVVFITGHATTATAIEATKLGAYDYLFKPLELDELRDVVETALEISRMQRVPAVLEDDATPTGFGSDVMVGQCPAMKDVYKAIGRVASQDVTVLITGESGTGKELVARAIYHHSQRDEKPFLAVNCAAIPETLLESEIFGHEKGAFTGAERQRIGKFEQCHGGTLFLDEIGDMSPLTQTKVLRVLAEQKFQRLGGDETVTTDVRLIAATNANLAERVAGGDFRQDLFYRLSVFAIHLPPLRERGEDIPRLIEHYLLRYSRDLKKEVRDVAPTARALLEQYQWPGNIRELQSVLKQAILHTTGPVLLPEFLPDFVRDPSDAARADLSDTASWQDFLKRHLQQDADDLYFEWQKLTESHLLNRVMGHTGGNLSQAARILGINRRTLRSKLRQYGLHPHEMSDE
ncbi:MAG: sigma-54-dependent Fis family transcriptional regulator [Planctomycetales bacterium]|nr:sigma-54-dependent Fis family transcriptional regulator [Planctomycetales bacterium]